MVSVSAMPLDWAEAVFHVLAHLARTASLPSTVFDSDYVAQARHALGPVEQRCLGDDVAALEAVVTTHERLAWLSWVARLHPNGASAVRVCTRSLAELVGAADTDPHALKWLLTESRPEAELLRCSALLELHPLEGWALPDLAAAASRLTACLSELESVAPCLGRVTVRLVRSLGWHGRAFDDEIWVGIGGETQSPPLIHAAWQATHEATVLEVLGRLASEGTQRINEREFEHASVALLALRASRRGLQEQHATWLSRFDEQTRGWASSAELESAWRDRIERWASNSG